jgi:hypothetical protein
MAQVPAGDPSVMEIASETPATEATRVTMRPTVEVLASTLTCTGDMARLRAMGRAIKESGGSQCVTRRQKPRRNVSVFS